MQLFTFEEIKKSIPLISINNNIKIENSNEKYAQSYNNIILYNYKLIVTDLNIVFNGNINLINYNLIQILAHEIVHVENSLNKPHLDKNDAYIIHQYNNQKSMQYSFINNYGYKKNHDAFIDEYCADIIGNLYALEYIMNFNLTKEELYEINKDIACQIYKYYRQNNYPQKEYNKLIQKEGIIEILLNKHLYGIPIIESFKKNTYKAITPNNDAINNTDFDKLMYGDNNNLVYYIKLIYEGKFRTINIFDYLYKQSEKKYQKILTNKK